MMHYLVFSIKNKEPIRIADDSFAQKGQTESLRYIPGSSIRGAVISDFMRNGYSGSKEELFTKVEFLNAYPLRGSKWLIPSPKGFYEDKTENDDEKELKNVVINGEVDEGLKRARLGEFCDVCDDHIFYYSVRSKGELKNRMYGNEMYRNEYIESGYMFGGAIASENKELLEQIQKFFDKDIYIGNARSSGMGRCSVSDCVIKSEFPYRKYASVEDVTGECYMMLLSPMSMRSESGEPISFDNDYFERFFGVEQLEIKYCSTSTRVVCGYNRTWKGPMPSALMYDKGSVFHLSFSGTIPAKKINEIMERGIGDRNYEGFGRVIILKDFDKWKYKVKGEDLRDNSVELIKEKTDENALRQTAKKYYREAIIGAMEQYIVSNPLDHKQISSRKARGIEPILTMNRFNYGNAVRVLNSYFENEQKRESEKKVHKELKSVRSIREHVYTVLEGDIEELLNIKTRSKTTIMTIPKTQLLDENELGELKLLFLLKELRFDGRKEG